jgi:hypothetical protein
MAKTLLEFGWIGTDELRRRAIEDARSFASVGAASHQAKVNRITLVVSLQGAGPSSEPEGAPKTSERSRHVARNQ